MKRKFNNFDTIDFLQFKTFSPDFIIMRLGENVHDSLAYSDSLNYYLTKLINYIKGNKNTIVCCTNSFWPNNNINSEILDACKKNNYIFVDISMLWNDPRNAAYDFFSDYAVSIHPSDFGMKNIADKIWYKIQKYF